MPDTVLVADDDAGVRQTIAAFLTAAGFEVHQTDHGDDALTLLTDPAQTFLAAVLDNHMPGLPGPEVLARVRSTRPDFPVLVVSGDADAATVAEVRSDARAGFLAKPFHGPALIAAIRELLHS